jgi:GNAT superfamily N-acetyltransferase
LATVVREKEIAGVLIDGPGHKVYESCAQWIIASEANGAEKLLVKALKARSPWDIEIAHGLLTENVLSKYPVKLGRDFMMKLNFDRFRLVDLSEGAFMGELHKESALKSMTDKWVMDKTGPMDWSPDAPLYVVVADEKIVACGEALVRDKKRASLGQIVTRDEYRGRGYSRAIISHICRELQKRNLSPQYLVSRDNEISLHLASSMGFETFCEFDCLSPVHENS